MQVSIQPIDKTTLQEMEPLLSQSIGYPTSMPDEIEYFTTENPKAWFVATDLNNQKIGFVRYFQQNDEWSQAELFVSECAGRKSVIKSLLGKFLQEIKLPKGHRLKFEFKTADKELNAAFTELDINTKKQTFHHFEMEIAKKTADIPFQMASEVDTEELANVLSHLHPVTEIEVKNWLSKGLIRVQMAGNKIASAAQVNTYPNSVEIVRIATHQDFLRQGHARNLIKTLRAELGQAQIPKLFLKVEDVRVPAIEFYKSMGFQDVSEKMETWHSVHF